MIARCPRAQFFVSLVLVLLISSAAAQQAAEPRPARYDAGMISGLPARNIGSATMSGRVAAVEVMTTTAFIRDCIIDKDKTSMIAGAIASGTSQYGMQTFDQAIFSLYSQKSVTLEEALRWASNVDDFKLKVAGISTTADMARDDMAAKTNAGAKPAAAAAPKPPVKTIPTIDRFGGR